jgi:hypothetical protein
MQLPSPLPLSFINQAQPSIDSLAQPSQPHNYITKYYSHQPFPSNLTPAALPGTTRVLFHLKSWQRRLCVLLQSASSEQQIKSELWSRFLE